METKPSRVDIEIVVKKSIPITRVADLLSCGFEGGVGYWCRIESYEEPPEKYSVHEFGCPEDVDSHYRRDHVYPYIDYPLTGGTVICRADGDDGLYRLDMDAIKHGLQRMSIYEPMRHWDAFMDENEDAETGDVFIQLCLFGEVRYG